MPGFSMMMEMAEAGRWRKPEDGGSRKIGNPDSAKAWIFESLDFRIVGFLDFRILAFGPRPKA